MTSHKVIGIFAALAGVWLASHHACSPVLATLLLLIACIAAYMWQGFWLMALPSAVVLLSFYPLTGSLVVNEYDIVLCGLMAGTLLRADCDGKVSRLLLVYFGPMAALMVIAAAHGWLSLPTAQAGDELSVYTTQSNVWQQIKVVLYGTILVPMIWSAIQASEKSHRAAAWRQFEIGFWISAFGVSAMILLERSVTVGIFNFQYELRVCGPCMSMHIGDQHVDAYWSLAIPFLFQFRYRRDLLTVGLCLLQLLALYAVFSTMSRATIAAVAIMILLLAVARLTWFRGEVEGELSGSKYGVRTFPVAFVTAGALFIMAVFAAALWFGGDAVPKRFADSLDGWRTRADHWSSIFKAQKGSIVESMIGNGLGSYPLRARQVLGRVEQPIILEPTDQGVGVRLHTGEAIYLEQLVNADAPLPWHIEFDAQTSDVGCRPSMIVCHKVLLQSFEVVNAELTQSGDHWSGTLNQLPRDATPVSSPVRKHWCPTSLAVMVGGDHGSMLLRELKVTDAAGNAVIHNGDFAKGSRFWFFTCDDHLIWRAKNCWLHLLVEMGWLGVAAFAFLYGAAITQLVRAIVMQRSWPACVLLCSLMGFFAVAWFGTLIDTPWIAILLAVVITASLAQSEPSRSEPTALAEGITSFGKQSATVE